MKNNLMYLSPYVSHYLESISYELSDYEKAVLILKCIKLEDREKALLDIANNTQDKKVEQLIYEHFCLESYEQELFETNDGSYIYLLLDNEEVVKVSRDIDIIKGIICSSATDENVFCVEKHLVCNGILKHHCGRECGEVAMCIYNGAGVAHVEIYNDDMLNKINKFLKNKKEVLRDGCIYIPLPFKKGDIVLFDYDDKRKIGVLEQDVISCSNGEINTVVFIDKKGYLCNYIFNPYTAEIVDSSMDSPIWDRLNRISNVVKGKEQYKISQVFRQIHMNV